MTRPVRCFGVVLTILLSAPIHAADQPNVLIIMADDCTHNDLPLYGGQNARTPNINQFARQGLTFNRAYLAEAMCQPCRAELYSGQFPLRNGCAWNHSASRPDVTSLPQHLRPLGYRVGLSGKVHVGPRTAFPFKIVNGFDKSCVRNPTQPHDLTAATAFMRGDGETGDQPFCLVICLVEPHVPWVMGDRSAYPPAKIKLPPNLADTPRTREEYAAYLAEITYMDGQVGEILAALDKTGKADDTLVLFTSEQGSQFPGNKWTNWDTGVHTALVARWPGKIAADQRTDAIVQYADVLPTLIDLAGGDARDQSRTSNGNQNQFDGTSFRRVLTGETGSHRTYAFGVHNNIPEGPAYPVRTVTDGRYRYIRNLTPGELYIEKHLMGRQGAGDANTPYWATWIAEAWNHPDTYRLIKRYQSRPAEELYDTASDPYEMTNLAGDANLAPMKARLITELDHWMKSQGDPGAPEDTHEAHQAAKKGQHLFGPTVEKAEYNAPLD
jgi:N-sulfoglucosamine sulfohydrolase